MKEKGQLGGANRCSFGETNIEILTSLDHNITFEDLDKKYKIIQSDEAFDFFDVCRENKTFSTEMHAWFVRRYEQILQLSKSDDGELSSIALDIVKRIDEIVTKNTDVEYNSHDYTMEGIEHLIDFGDKNVAFYGFRICNKESGKISAFTSIQGFPQT